MRKVLRHRNLNERPAARVILAVTLAMTLAAFGCTTNRMPGNGEPTYGSPSGGAMPVSVTPGSSSGSTGTPPPMTSSYRGDSAAITINSARVRQSPDDAAAIIASQRRVMILGTSAPGTSGRAYVSDGRTNQFTYPGLVTNPQITVNSSIHSVNAGPAITSGASVDTSVVADAAVFPATGTIVTPTTAALGVSPGVVAGGAVTVSPTTGSVTGTSGAAATPTPATAALNVSPTVANSVQITNANGRVTVTNVPSGRNQ